MRWLLLGLVVAFVACSSALPSTEPLGVGPKAARGDAGARAVASSAATSPDAGPKQEAPSEAASEARPRPPEAEPAADAGPTDATATAQTGSPDAASDAGTSSGSSGAAATLAGTYYGWDTTTYRIPNAPPPERDQNARTRVVLGSGDAIELIVVNSATGQDLCALKGKLKAGNVTLDNGQRCFEEGGGMVTATLTKGSARFSGKRLVMDAEFELEIETGEDTIEGEIVYHFEGDRK